MARTSLADRFWSRCDRKGEDECWTWQGSTHRDQARFKIGQRWTSAMKIAWHLRTGEPIDDADVYRACGNRACVNPFHMRRKEQEAPPAKPDPRFYDSYTWKMRDVRNEKQTGALGAYLRRRYQDEDATLRELAEELDVSVQTVHSWMTQFRIPRRPRGRRTLLVGES